MRVFSFTFIYSYVKDYPALPSTSIISVVFTARRAGRAMKRRGTPRPPRHRGSSRGSAPPAPPPASGPLRVPVGLELRVPVTEPVLCWSLRKDRPIVKFKQEKYISREMPLRSAYSLETVAVRSWQTLFRSHRKSRVGQEGR